MNDNKIKPIVFATHNANKLAEIREITRGEVEVLGLTDIGCHEEIDETGSTLEENALIKARQVKERYGYDCFADDTGLEVDALNGVPGIYSARYAGPSCDSEANMQKMLSVLQGIDDRSAQFRTVIALWQMTKNISSRGSSGGRSHVKSEATRGSGMIRSSYLKGTTSRLL